MAAKDSRLKAQRSFWYTLARVLCFVLMPLFFPVRYHNKDRVKMKPGPWILASNHSSMLDPIVLALPVYLHEIRYLGKKELGANKLFSYILRQLHMISVSRHMTDMAAMRACNQVLREGNVLGIFPEGTRTPYQHLMEGVESGFALIALRNQVPLMPVYIHGKPRPLRLTHVYFLPELDYSHLQAQGINQQTCDQLRDLLRDKLHQARKKADNKI